MSTDKTLQINSESSQDTLDLGEKIGQCLKGGEVIELVSDLGGGKTELVRGIAKGVNSSDQVASPTFTISRQYRAKDKDLTIHHFDFYRLQEPELMQEELSEVLGIPNHVVVIEWAQSVKEALPEDRLVIEFSTTGEDKRNIQITAGRDHQHLLESL